MPKTSAGGSPLDPPSVLERKMKRRIHPYSEPKLIIHTNGSTYLTGIPLLRLRGGCPWLPQEASKTNPVSAAGGPQSTTASSVIPLSSTNRVAAQKTPRRSPQNEERGADLQDTLPPEPKLLCFGEGSATCAPARAALQGNSLSFFSKAKEKVQQHLFTSYLIKYLDLPSSARSSSSMPEAPSSTQGGAVVLGGVSQRPPRYVTDRASGGAELQLAQSINKKMCLVLDTDVISNPLWNGNANLRAPGSPGEEDSALFKFKKRYGLNEINLVSPSSS
jgi:hypothetical protein